MSVVTAGVLAVGAVAGSMAASKKSGKQADAAAQAAQRDLGQETKDTLQAQVDMAPALYDAEAKYRPQYAALDQSILYNTMLGQNGTVDLLANATPELTDIQSQANTQSRSADLADVQSLGPAYSDAMRAANPQLTAVQDKLAANATTGSPILQTLRSQTLSDLQQGRNLAPDEVRNAQQSVRSAYAARGLSRSNPAIFAEALNRSQYGNARQAQRQQSALQVDQYDNSLLGTTASQLAANKLDPVAAILGRNSQSTGAANTALGQSGFSLNSSNKLFDPYNSYAQDVYSSNSNMLFSAGMAKSNNSAAMAGGLMKLGGTFAGAAMG